MSEDTLIVWLKGYKETAELKIGEDNLVENHEELAEEGNVFTEVRAYKDTEANRSAFSDSHIVEEGDPAWRESFAEMEAGDVKRID